MSKKIKCFHEKHGNYYYTPTIGGKTKWINLGKDKQFALARYYQLQDSGVVSVTVNDLLDNYVKSEAYSVSKFASSTIKNYEWGMDNVREQLGHIEASELNATDISRFIHAAPGNAGNGWVNPLSNAYKRGILDGLVETTPFRKGDIQYAPASVRVRLVGYEEIEKVKGAIGKEGELFIDITLLTALRVSDVLSLNRQSITEDGLVVSIKKRSKAHQTLLFNWTPELRALADMLPTDDWDVSPQAMSARFNRACKKVGVENLTCHDVRRYVLQECKRLGLSAQQIAGHASYRQTSNYLLGVADQVQTMPGRKTDAQPGL